MAIVRCRQCWCPVDAVEKTCPKCGARIRKRVSKPAIALACLLVVVGLITYHRDSPLIETAPPRPIDPAAQAGAEAIKNLDFLFSWTKGKPGSVMFIDITLTNTGARDVKDIVIVCEHILDSGIVPVKNRSILYEMIKASETKTFPRFNMGYLPVDTPKTRCHVENLIVL